MSRQLRRGVALLIAAGLTAGCGVVHHAAAGPVPWRNRPLPRYHVPTPRLIPYPTAAPRCLAKQLRISEGRDGAAAGTLYEQLVFTNSGRSSCVLRGFPTITAIAPDGNRRSLHPRHASFSFFSLLAANLPPNGHSFLGLATSDGCDNGTKPSTTYRRPTFTTAAGQTIRTGAAITITEVCGLYLSGFGLPARYTPLRPAAATPATATARVQLPVTVRAGAVLHYTLSLSNPTATAISLRPCPGYTEGIYASGVAVRGSFALNCDSVQTIGPHARVVYAMQLSVPSRTATGVAKFSWSLNDPTGPFAGHTIRVTR